MRLNETETTFMEYVKRWKRSKKLSSLFIGICGQAPQKRGKTEVPSHRHFIRRILSDVDF